MSIACRWFRWHRWGRIISHYTAGTFVKVESRMCLDCKKVQSRTVGVSMSQWR
jgi:hypothetical protein